MRAVERKTTERLEVLANEPRGKGSVHDGLLKAKRNLELNNFDHSEIVRIFKPFVSRFSPGEIQGIVGGMG